MITSAVFWGVLIVAGYAYWRFPKYRDWTLVVTAVGFLAWADWRSVVAVLALATLSNLAVGKWQKPPKWVIALLVVAALGFLASFKYLPGLLELIHPKPPRHIEDAKKAQEAAAAAATMVVPLGASYFTFKLVHYLVDSRRGQLPKHDLKTFLGYMLFLPMFTAGPIERFEDYLKNRSDKLTKEHIAEGGTRILHGLVKKMVVVDILLARRIPVFPTSLSLDSIPLIGRPCSLDSLLEHTGNVNPLLVWQFTIHQFTTWYLDFSAYSDIAIGTALFFGIKLTENFNWPLLAANPTDFWKRYHVTLSAWCQRYVYLPVMGRSRNPYVAVYATMITMAMWHAGSLNYLAWGCYHATVLSLYLTWGRIKRWRKWKPKGKPLLVASTIATSLTVCVSAVFPSTGQKGLGAALRLLGALVGIRS